MNRLKGFLLIVLVFSQCMIRAFAMDRDTADIMQIISEEDQVKVYIAGLGNYDGVEAQIGRVETEVSAYGKQSGGHLIILADNSLSIKKKDRDKISEIIKQIVSQKDDTQKISIAVYGEDIQYIVEAETKVEEIMDSWENIEYQDRDTYLTDVLYEELLKLKDKNEYTTFLVITDGVDNKEIGYTKEELIDLLKEIPCPIYSLGTTTSENSEELENLFALSRLTNACYYLLDDYEEENYNEIVNDVLEPIECITLQIPDQLKDGSTQNILLTINTLEGIIKLYGKVTMHFSINKTEESAPEIEFHKEPKLVSSPLLGQESVEVKESDSIPEQKQEYDIDWISVGAIAVIVVVVTFFGVVQITKRNKDDGKSSNRMKKEKKKNRKTENQGFPKPLQEEHTEFVAPQENSEATVFLAREKVTKIVVLQDAEDSSKIFKYPLQDKVIIGRKGGNGVNIILNYEPSVSACHCEITESNGHYYVEDLNSSNGTYLNGRNIVGRTEFMSGSLLKLGKLIMRIEIEQI